MNKSKFLKRSLAALLAILMVAAMIPASAFAAAGDPDVIKIGGEVAEFDGEKYTVSLTLPSGTSGIVENTLKALQFELRSENGTTVGIIDKDNKMIGASLLGRPDISTAKKTVDVWSKSNRPADSLWGDYTGMQLRVTTKGNAPVSYPLVISVAQRHASSDTTLAAVESTRIVNYEIDEATKTVTIIKPIGTNDNRNILGLTKDSFKPTNKNATVTVTPTTAGTPITGITVIAEDKSQQKYDVTYKVEQIFEEFGVKDVEVLNEVTETENNHDGQVNMTVKIPYGTKPEKLIPTFIPCDTVKTIQADDGFTNRGSDVDLYRAADGKTTSGIANWATGTEIASDDAGNHAPLTTALGQAETYTIKVQTSVSSNWGGSGQTGVTNTGNVKITFIPVKNNEAKISGVKVSTQTNAGGTYNQVVQTVDGTYPTIYIGDVSSDLLADKNNEYNTNGTNNTTVVPATNRNVKLYVSADSKVTWVNHPTVYNVNNISVAGADNAANLTQLSAGSSFEQIKVEHTDNNGNYPIEFANVDLRAFYSDYMHIKVESEDGSNAEDYYINFHGTPSGTPEISGVTLHGTTKNGIDYADVSSFVRNSDGNLEVHVPHNSSLESVAASDLRNIYTSISVRTSNGATVFGCQSATYSGVDQLNHAATPVILNEYTSSNDVGIYSTKDQSGHINAANWPDGCDFAIILDTSFTKSSTEANAAVGEDTVKYVYIFVDGPSTNAVIDSIKVTNKTTLLSSYNEVYEGEINPDKKTIRIEVPFSFGKNANGVYSDQPIYVYDWDINGVSTWNSTNVSASVDAVDYEFANLGNQCATYGALVTLGASAITDAADEGTYDTGNGAVIRVWSEAFTGTQSTTNATETYHLYAVRQPANDAHELLNVTSTDPKVSVSLDQAVPSLNRWIINVPENYDSQNGVSQAPEFELVFDRSEKSTVKNGNNTWVAADKTSAAFKVAGGNLYFKNEKVTVTDGRVIHFTVVAEDGRATGEYEFVINHAEPSDDATLSSVKVDDEVSFEKTDDNNYVVKDLTDDENYDVTKLPVIITTTDPGATVTVDGKAYTYNPADGSNITVDLSEDKTATVEVTAADGETKATYTLSMSNGTTPDVKPSDSYTDLEKVYSGHRERVIYAIDNGLMSNDGTAGVFNSEGKIARQDFALIVARADMRAENPDAEDVDALLREKYADTPDAFDDIAKLNATQKAALAYCKEKNIISGNGKGGFNPAGAVSREDAAIIIASWCGLEHTDTENTNNIKDWNSVSSWAKPFVNAAYKAGLMNGTGNDNFTPARNLNRGEAAYIIVGALNQKVPSSN